MDGRPLDPETQKELPDRAVLEKPELPTHQEWNDAFAKAGRCFGITFSGKHLSPDNLGRFQAAVDAVVEKIGGRAAEVATALGQRAVSIELNESIERVVTAKSAEQMVLAVRGKAGVGQVRGLASIEPHTSAFAVGSHLGRLDELALVLQDALVFGAFEQVAQRDELEGGAELLEELRSAFRQDEHHVRLAPRLRELANRAQALLTARPTETHSTKKVFVSSKASAVGKEAIRTKLQEITRQLEAALEEADGDLELTGTLTLSER